MEVAGRKIASPVMWNHLKNVLTSFCLLKLGFPGWRRKHRYQLKLRLTSLLITCWNLASLFEITECDLNLNKTFKFLYLSGSHMSLVCEFQNPWFHIIYAWRRKSLPQYFTIIVVLFFVAVIGSMAPLCLSLYVSVSRPCFTQAGPWGHSICYLHLPTPPPPHPQIMTEIWTLKFLLEFFVKRNPKGSFLWQHIWNICPKSQNLVCFFEEKTKPSYLKTCHPWGGGKK